MYTLEKTQGPKKTQGSRKNSGFCQFSSKIRSKTAIFGSLYLIRLQKTQGPAKKNSGFWMSCSSIDIHRGVQKKAWTVYLSVVISKHTSNNFYYITVQDIYNSLSFTTNNTTCSTTRTALFFLCFTTFFSRYQAS